MECLLPEIIHVICSSLPINDVRNFRLTCRTYSEIAACYALEEVVFYLHHSDFKALEAISHHPVVSKNVRSLVYVAHTLADPLLSFEEFVGEYDYHRAMDKRVNADMDSQYRKRLERRLNTTQLQAAYQKYEETHSHQTRILESRDDFRCLREVIARLPALREIKISSGFWDREGGDFKTPFVNCIQRPYSNLKPEACRQLVSLLQAVEGARTQLVKLAVGCIDWRFFRNEISVVKSAWHSLANLTVVEFFIDTGIEGDMDEVGTEVPQCREVMRSGVLRKFLSSLKHLKGIFLKFSFHSEDHGYAARLGDIIAPGHCWPQLGSLGLGNVECERQELETVLQLHKSSLKHICLEDICLRTTSWKQLLPRIRDTLELKGSCVCGQIRGCGEDSAPSSEPPVDESWDCGNTFWGLTDVGIQVNDYLTRDVEEMPLRDRDMVWLGDFD